MQKLKEFTIKNKCKEFCKDGEQIETVEVYAGFKESEPYAAYIDTPGIDFDGRSAIFICRFGSPSG